MGTKTVFYTMEDFKKDPFFKFPSWLFFDERYKLMSQSAKVLYMYFLDRNRLSHTNEENFTDKRGHIYFICTRARMQELLNCGYNQPRFYISELKRYGLIEETRPGQGNANLLFLKRPENPSTKPKTMDMPENNIDEEIVPPSTHDEGAQERPEPNSKTENNYELPPDEPQTLDDEAITKMESELKANIDYESLRETHEHDIGLVDECVSVMLDVVCSESKTIRIGGEDKPRSLVKRQIMRLNYDDIVRCIHQFESITTPIKKKPEYIRTMLYNAKLETDAHYTNLHSSRPPP